jgi:hypothetical protein
LEKRALFIFRTKHSIHVRYGNVQKFLLVFAACFFSKVYFVKKMDRLKKFILRFVVVPFTWIYHSKQKNPKIVYKKRVPTTYLSADFLIKTNKLGKRMSGS